MAGDVWQISLFDDLRWDHSRPMKITRIDVYQKTLHLSDAIYSWSKGRSVEALDALRRYQRPNILPGQITPRQ